MYLSRTVRMNPPAIVVTGHPMAMVNHTGWR